MKSESQRKVIFFQGFLEIYISGYPQFLTNKNTIKCHFSIFVYSKTLCPDHRFIGATEKGRNVQLPVEQW